MLISANDLIALYLGLELISLALYVLAAIDRDSMRSTEAGLKYFVLGALSSGMLLYGASLIYGFTGTVSFAGIAKAAREPGLGLIFGLVFPVRRILLQDIGSSVSHVDARRLRGRAHADHGILRCRSKSCSNRGVCANRHCRFSCDTHSVAADRRIHRHSLDGARFFRSHRAAKHQTADGLFVHWPYGVCVDWTCRRARRRACRVFSSTSPSMSL